MQVLDRPKGAVQLKHHHRIEPVLNRVVLQLPPGGAVEQIVGTGLVDVGLGNVPVGVLADKLSQAQPWGFGILVFVAGTDAGIAGDAHGKSRPFYLSTYRQDANKNRSHARHAGNGFRNVGGQHIQSIPHVGKGKDPSKEEDGRVRFRPPWLKAALLI